MCGTWAGVARGVRGIEMRDPDSGEISDRIVGVELLEDEPDMLLLTITENGYGKRTPLTEYRVQKRGGRGIINIRTGERNGPAVGSLQVHEDDKIMLITDTGRVIKTRVSEVRETGRAAMGVTLMRVDDDERVVSVARVVDEEDEEISEEAGEE
jgi:DNA gyrase subunit A